jgi:hypothetical protein
MLPDQRPPFSARAIAAPGAWRALRRQVRSDIVAVARAVVATSGEIVLVEMVRIPALNSLACVSRWGSGSSH